MELTGGGCEERLRRSLSSLGFEIYPLKISWYNAVVSADFSLSYPEDTLALVVLSSPGMFERAFQPFLKNLDLENVRDPIDQCVAHHVTWAVREEFPGQRVDVMYDYEVLPSRKPKFLAQSAAHVAGAAYYYQRRDVTSDPWGEKKMFGVCIHPRYGGWFAVRALLVFPDVTLPEMLPKDPPDCVPSREKRIELLERFNFSWKDWSYRDIIAVEERYSEEQKAYFITVPAERLQLLKK
ncbi:cyanocobalamin reductase / alkylcobalamin dealkylase [Erpetoichthys calabaricus]|uniref:cyanocobalamin reductase / alkylcobalamin dealkylase n=1 Tax=Erpetoichthys calabaricus TaxID=27687 RepID=UPI002234A4B9|nr:cyanocobalamin reductase / alkylcobalamin dealkylase [Erpetoichthys calabaricus]XP_051789226.1 cyanocobalamin reductase / alkylcobalamin dealkylase [Erpetoichthys calabaricus]